MGVTEKKKSGTFAVVPHASIKFVEPHLSDEGEAGDGEGEGGGDGGGGDGGGGDGIVVPCRRRSVASSFGTTSRGSATDTVRSLAVCSDTLLSRFASATSV